MIFPGSRWPSRIKFGTGFFEHHALETAPRGALYRARRRYAAHIEEKLEPIFEESQELLVRFVPQVAVFV